MHDFYEILEQWWKDADSHRGNLALSAELVAKQLVLRGVFKEREPCRRNIL
jgi:hypothetical protein